MAAGGLKKSSGGGGSAPPAKSGGGDPMAELFAKISQRVPTAPLRPYTVAFL
jgi:hypothetical protein